MKVYLLDDTDFARLLLEIGRDPRLGTAGGSSVVLTAAEKEAYEQAHRFFNYTIRRWIDSVRQGK